MFDNNELYNLLSSGHSAEDIAAFFTSSLNEAEARVKEEQEAAEKARLEERQKDEAKKERLSDITDAILTFWSVVKLHYPSLVDQINISNAEATAEYVVNLLDNVVKPKREEEIFRDFFYLFGLI